MEEVAWVSGSYRPLAKGAFLNTLRELKTLIKEIQRINVYVQDDTIKVIDRYGNDVGYDKRLEDIKNRYGKDSKVYNKCCVLVDKIKGKLQLE